MVGRGLPAHSVYFRDLDGNLVELMAAEECHRACWPLGVFRSQPYHPPLRRLPSHMFGRRIGFTNNLLPPVQRGGISGRRWTPSAHREPTTTLCVRQAALAEPGKAPCDGVLHLTAESGTD
jgi:hypothetical protein